MATRDNNAVESKKWAIYKRCLYCQVKAHIDTRKCFRCGRPLGDMTYGSENPNDYIYNWLLNKPEKCFTCRNTQNGKPCKYVICFGTGGRAHGKDKDNCESCKVFNTILYDCCQEVQRQDGRVTSADYKRLQDTITSLNNRKGTQNKYDDEIPF